MKLYNEMKEAMREVINAENAAKAWNMEARALMKNVDTIARAAQKIDPEVRELSIMEIRAKLREELMTEANAAAEPTDPDDYLTREVLNEDPAEPAEEPEPCTAGAM